MPDKLLSPEYGLSNSKLEECTANPSDVMNGKTFYSGDKTKKTGTFSFTGNAMPSDVLSGKTFYSGDKNLKTGTFNLGNSSASEWDVVEGKTFYSGNTTLRYGNIPNMSNPGGLVDGFTHVSIATIVGYGNYDTGVATDRWVPVIVIKPNRGYYDGGANANIAIDSRIVKSNMFKTAAFDLRLDGGGVEYGETLDKYWNPGGRVVGLQTVHYYGDTDSGEAYINDMYCEIVNEQLHFVCDFTHRRGTARVWGTALYL